MNRPDWVPDAVDCPSCGERSGVPIIYGYPTTEAEQAAQRGEILLGGCMTSPDDVDLVCRVCGHGWLRPPKPVTWFEDPARPSFGLIVSAALAPNGDLKISGQDLSPAVAEFFGEPFDEYEWWVTVARRDCSSLVAAYGYPAETSVLQVFSDDPSRLPGVKRFLDEHRTPYDFDSHLGS